MLYYISASRTSLFEILERFSSLELGLSHNLLLTKLFIPPERKNLVPRPRLAQILDQAWQQDQNLALVSAPAGYGKTTLVTAWLRGLPAKSAWLSLDKNDNDPARFLAYLIAALGQVDERIGENTRLLLQSPQPLPPDVVLTALINEIALAATSFVLVLDDYHLIQSLPVHGQLGFLVDHQPPQLRLVIITREDPPLPLARLRARGQLVEIRQDDLRFSIQECADFLLRVMGLELTQADISLLEQRTEGWIAGLQLAALTMQGRSDLPEFVASFTGGSHYVLEYLIEEVFARHAPEEQEFLLKTSILDRLSGPLCDAVVGRAGSAALLNSLEHANLFVIPLDQVHNWYRYHHLFAELLRQRLHAADPLAENELHGRASRWFAPEGLFPEAIYHALAASDWNRAADLICDHTVMMLRRGELVTLLGWLRSLPEGVVFERALLCRDYGLALSLTGQLDAADIYLRQAAAAAQGDEAMLGTILVAQAYNLRVRGDNVAAIERARLALNLLPQEDHLSRSLVALTLGLAYWNHGDFQAAEQAFAQVEQFALLSRNHYARMTALTYLGMIQANYGRLRRAAELCRQVIDLGGASPTVAPAHIELGALLYEWNDLAAARRQLELGIELSQRTGNLSFQSDGYRTLALVQQACAEPQAALSTLQKADQLVAGRQVSPLLQMRHAACHVLLALAQHDLESAQVWAAQVTEEIDTSLLFHRLGLTPARLLLAQNKKPAAAERLSQLYQVASQAGCGSGVIEVRLLQALAADTPEAALRFLEEALHRARSAGFIRLFVDKGEPMRALLARLRSSGGELKEYILTLLSAFGEPAEATPQQSLVEPLSARELEVLRLVAQGLSNGEIAQRLVVSLGTVKSHVHSLIAKLSVHSRTQAIARARELDLL